MTNKQKHNQQQENITMQHKKWVAFTYFSPLIRRVTNLFKQTYLKVAFRAVNTIQQQLTEKQIHNSPSGIHKLKCNTRNRVYVGQSDRAIKKEHTKYIRTNNSTSAYAAHILENRL
jgi:hypothetical protein